MAEQSLVSARSSAALTPAGLGTVGVFGAKGFLGRHLVRRLLSTGHPVVAFGRSFPVDYAISVGGNVEARDIDFSDVVGMHAKLQDISIVVQLINSSSPSIGNSLISADFTSNVAPHVNFIESCTRAGIKSFIFISSGGTVYGNPEYTPIDERHPTSPINSYGLTKLIVEQYVRLFSQSSTMNYVNLRVSNPFGPGQVFNKGQGLIAAIIQNHRNKRPVMIYGDGMVQRDYIFIDDVVDAVVAAITVPGLRETLNIGSGIGRSALDVISAFETILSERMELSYADDRPTDARANILDSTRARALLNWAPRTDFLDGLRRTIQAAS